jgi:hypothetical protein
VLKELIKIANELDQRGLHKEAGILDGLVDLLMPGVSKIHSGVEKVLSPMFQGAATVGSNAGTALVTMNKICKRKEDIFRLLDAAKIVRIFNEEKSEALIIGAIVKGTGLSEEKVITGIELLEKHFGFGMKEVFEKAEYIKATIRMACKLLEGEGLIMPSKAP